MSATITPDKVQVGSLARDGVGDVGAVPFGPSPEQAVSASVRIVSTATYAVESAPLVALLEVAGDRVPTNPACSKRIGPCASQVHARPSCATDTVCAGEGNGRSARSATVSLPPTLSAGWMHLLRRSWAIVRRGATGPARAFSPAVSILLSCG